MGEYMKILLMGLEFRIGNKGCEALSYSFLNILSAISNMNNTKLEVSALVFSPSPEYINVADVMDVNLINVQYKSFRCWKRIINEMKKSQLIVDFTMGDSFSDIYGMKRFIKTTLLKQLAIYSGTKLMLGPQTYGPFRNKLCQKWSKAVINKSSYVYTRDSLSAEYVYNLCGKRIVTTTDIAFALPYDKSRYNIVDSKIKIGFNPSGLLWVGGYTGKNQFKLSIDYKMYCMDLIEKLSNDDRYTVYLIPHVWGNLKHIEDDVKICKDLKIHYPNVVVASGVDNSIDIKSYIANMDVFIGARMHATIASFSSRVATIAFSYSRKFEGLFDSIDYPYVINARLLTNKEAVNQTLIWINEYRFLREKVEKSMRIVEKHQKRFFNDLEYILLDKEGDINE